MVRHWLRKEMTEKYGDECSSVKQATKDDFWVECLTSVSN
jgi:hypothetical protein